MRKRMRLISVATVLSLSLLAPATGVAIVETVAIQKTTIPAMRLEPGCSPGVPSYNCGQAKYVFNFLTTHGFSPPPGLKGGSKFRDEDGKLPAGGDYLEYYLYSKNSQGTPPQRLVVDRSNPQGNTWFTPDHYDTFVQFYIVATR